MKNWTVSCSILFVLIANNSKAQSTSANNTSNLDEFKFESILGTRNNDKKTTYCLLGTGFFRAPRSRNSDSLITNWLIKYPKAIVIPISSISPILETDPSSKMIYCWVVYKTDTLNNYLIRKGAFPGGTMLRPPEKNGVEYIIDVKTYNNFIKQIQSAEIYASEQKLGIWEKEIKK